MSTARYGVRVVVFLPLPFPLPPHCLTSKPGSRVRLLHDPRFQLQSSWLVLPLSNASIAPSRLCQFRSWQDFYAIWSRAVLRLLMRTAAHCSATTPVTRGRNAAMSRPWERTS